tara:strand:+ start:468 stop:779 length:312 start_codon:yes stop_codon:yes gene_type:complete
MAILLSQSLESTNYLDPKLALIFQIAFIIIICYALIIRPQKLKQKKREDEIDSLKIGDKILTRGGLLGKIINFEGKNDENVLIELNQNVKVTIKKYYISNKIT